MEPNLPTPNPSPEMGGYRQQETPTNPETSALSMPDQKPERPETREAAPAPSQNGPTLPMPKVVAQNLPTSQKASQNTPLSNDTPLIVADEDVIEQEWVNKAKKIVAETKDDPYEQEKEVSKLQASYLKTRYGKEVKITDD